MKKYRDEAVLSEQTAPETIHLEYLRPIDDNSEDASNLYKYHLLAIMKHLKLKY